MNTSTILVSILTNIANSHMSCVGSYTIIKNGISLNTSSCNHVYQHVQFKDKQIIKNINLLHKMGYLPFKVIAYVPTIKDQRAIYDALVKWDDKAVPRRLMNMIEPIVDKNNIIYTSAIQRVEKHGNINNIQLAYSFGIKAKKPFVWVFVNQKKRPEKLYVWQSNYSKNNGIVFDSLVNTGVEHTTTPGTFTVYIRLRSTEMRGYFPGTHQYYDDPDIPWVNYFHKGEAIHGYPRYAYGFPQSAGCVELPIRKAKKLYPILYKGALVTISGW